MDKPTLEESLKYLAQYEPHYSVVLQSLKELKEDAVSALCNSVTKDNDKSVDRYHIGQISMLNYACSILEQHRIKK